MSKLYDVIVGQPFINHKDVSVFIHGNQIWLFSNFINVLTDIDKLPPRQVDICAKKTTVIPARHVGSILVCSDQNFEDVLVDVSYRNWPGKSHIIPRCVTNVRHGGFLQIMNISDGDVRYEKGRIVARGCKYAKTNIPIVPCMNTEIRNVKPFVLEDICKQVNSALCPFD